jgi:hypothetical protein
MASINGVIFSESMADILANPVDICFGSMPATSTAPAACLVIEGNAVTTNQQIGADLSSETHPPTPSDLIAGIHRVQSMLSETIKVCERVKHPRTTSSTSSMPLGLRNAAHVASRYMKRKIQIESGHKTQDRGNCRNHLDEPCPIHEKSKRTARQCRVLKKLCRPLTTAHRRRMDQESSPGRLAFQVAIQQSPRTIREKSSRPQIARSWSSLRTYHHKMEKQMSNDKSVKTPMLPGPSGDNKSSPLLPQLQANHRLMPVKSTSTSGNKHLRHQLPRSSDAATIHLVLTDCVREISSETSSTTDSKFTTYRKPTWELLLLL